jgi:hypothetical protein
MRLISQTERKLGNIWQKNKHLAVFVNNVFGHTFRFLESF